LNRALGEVSYEHLLRCSREVRPVQSAEVQAPEPVICGKNDDGLYDHCDIHAVDPARVEAVRRRLVPPSVAGQMATVFKVLADQSRCRLMAAIIEAGELCVCDLAATVDMSESNVSHHLRVLRANGLVRARRAGKMVFYAPDDAHIRVLLDITREHVEHGPEYLSRRQA
jgi:DNA-binding transcriptional ArsR family regulator